MSAQTATQMALAHSEILDMIAQPTEEDLTRSTYQRNARAVRTAKTLKAMNFFAGPIPKDMLNYLLNSLPLVGFLIVWAARLEIKIARIQTDITWLKKELPRCQPPSEDHTQ
ncbi:hypothetical protein ES702_06748 [subsurface metagenome]